MKTSEERAIEFTRIVSTIRRGEKDAALSLLPVVYEELRHVARALMARESPGQTLQPTALVHEAYLRLIGDKRTKWESRSYFFAAAATAMRRILVERARKRKTVKHGGGQARVTLMDTIASCDPPAAELLALDEALGRLEAHDERASRIVHLRYFAGLSIEETAELMEISTVTVTREWTYARAWLQREITGGRRGKQPS